MRSARVAGERLRKLLVAVADEIGDASNEDQPQQGSRSHHPEPLAFLPLFHALGELCLLVALPERFVELLRRLVLPGELLELLLALWRILESRLICADRRAETLLLGLQDLDLGLDGFDRFPNAQGVRA